MPSFLQVIALLALLVAGVHSHSYLSALIINGTALAEGDCMRPIPSSEYDYPISSLDNPKGITSNAMMCGALPEGTKAAKRKCPVNPGDTIGVQWHYEKGLGSKDTYIIAPDHKGPCIVYLAKSETGTGAVWFKIFEDGYDTVSKTFCVTRMIANKGRFNFKLPTDITPGNYLMRVEIIALHEGEQVGGAQPYVHCAEITLGGSGTVNPSTNLVAFPGAYTATTPGVLFDIYKSKMPAYPVPGPAVYVSGSSSTPTPTDSTTSKPPALTTSKPPASTTSKPASTTSKAASTTSKPASTTSKPVSTTSKPKPASTTSKLAVTTEFSESSDQILGSSSGNKIINSLWSYITIILFSAYLIL